MIVIIITPTTSLVQGNDSYPVDMEEINSNHIKETFDTRANWSMHMDMGSDDKDACPMQTVHPSPFFLSFQSC